MTPDSLPHIGFPGEPFSLPASADRWCAGLGGDALQILKANPNSRPMPMFAHPFPVAERPEAPYFRHAPTQGAPPHLRDECWQPPRSRSG